jgi:hypothetical protein
LPGLASLINSAHPAIQLVQRQSFVSLNIIVIRSQLRERVATLFVVVFIRVKVNASDPKDFGFFRLRFGQLHHAKAAIPTFGCTFFLLLLQLLHDAGTLKILFLVVIIEVELGFAAAVVAPVIVGVV